MKYVIIISVGLASLLLVHAQVFGEDTVSGSSSPVNLRISEVDLREAGVFGFPQKWAKVICDNDELRLSAWNNSEYFYVQAVLWKDNSPALGKTDDGRAIGDNSGAHAGCESSWRGHAQGGSDLLAKPMARDAGLVLPDFFEQIFVDTTHERQCGTWCHSLCANPRRQDRPG